MSVVYEVILKTKSSTCFLFKRHLQQTLQWQLARSKAFTGNAGGIYYRQISFISRTKYKQYNFVEAPKFKMLRSYTKLVGRHGPFHRGNHKPLTRSKTSRNNNTGNKNRETVSKFSSRKESGKKALSSIVEPVKIKLFENPDDINIGMELTGKALSKDDILKIIAKFYTSQEVKKVAASSGIDTRLFHRAYVSFRQYCVDSEALPVELHVTFSDILQGGGHVDDLFPFFLNHAKQMYPHLECMEDLQKISDLTLPANWYPEARAIQRKVIFHAGPTNSGKTHHALKNFANAKSGVYCGPLRLLANEVFHRTNAGGTPCDLVTGEERRFVNDDGSPCNHVACTVEMTMTHQPYDVAVIDEIQMIRDNQRGWAWTRALLGVCAHEVHLCGEASAISLVRELLYHTGDTLEVRKYKRLTSLTVLNKAVGKFENVRDGDCIVCFSKNDIYHVSRKLEQMGKKCAVIYGTLPAGTKVAQAQMFNDIENDCKIMVATDAVGMGLNLNIKRIIFYSVVKPTMTEQGEIEISQLPVSLALQIAGRAGRYGTQYSDGEVTTFYPGDLPTLQDLLEGNVEEIEQAGLNPTAEQIELFAYHLPKATLSNLIDIFVTVAQMDSNLYFMCNMDDFKFLADMIEHVPLPLRTRYVFCCAPISKKNSFTCSMFLRFARQFSQAEPLTCEWLGRQINWPLKIPRTIDNLVHLEAVFDVLDLYLWLSYRFQDMFPHPEEVRQMQTELDEIIQLGVVNITKLVESKETRQAAKEQNIEDDYSPVSHKQDLEVRVFGSSEKQDKMTSFKTGNKSQHVSADVAHSKPPDIADKLSKVDMTGETKLTTQLLELGILTDEMMEKLKQELSGSAKSDAETKASGKKKAGEKPAAETVVSSNKPVGRLVNHLPEVLNAKKSGPLPELQKQSRVNSDALGNNELLKAPKSLAEQFQEAVRKTKNMTETDDYMTLAEQFQKESLSFSDKNECSTRESKGASLPNLNNGKGTDRVTDTATYYPQNYTKEHKSPTKHDMYTLGDKSNSTSTTEEHLTGSSHTPQHSDNTKSNMQSSSVQNNKDRSAEQTSSTKEHLIILDKFQQVFKGLFKDKSTRGKNK